MKNFRVIVVFLALTFFLNGNLSSSEERFFSTDTHIQKVPANVNSFDELVDSFDATIITGKPEIFLNEIKSSEEKN